MEAYELTNYDMTLLQAIILGIIQGLTEFIPVSSSGHIALGQYYFNLGHDMLFFLIVHIGTLVPVIVVFWKDVWALVRNPFQKMTLLLIVASVPIGLVGLFMRGIVGEAFGNIGALAAGFVFTGFILLISDRMKKGKKTTNQITYFDALCVGAAQAVAIFPGISRSGSTITAALARGIKREDAAKFIFLMSIPAILGSLFVEIIDLARDYTITMADINFANLTAGLLTSMVAGYFAVKFMMAAIKKAKLRYFAFYVLILAAVIGVYAMLT